MRMQQRKEVDLSLQFLKQDILLATDQNCNYGYLTFNKIIKKCQKIQKKMVVAMSYYNCETVHNNNITDNIIITYYNLKSCP